MQVTEKLKQDVATAFLKHLKADIGNRNYATLIGRVRTDKPWEQGICYSHDYCDANMDMLAAMEEVTGVPWEGLDKQPHWWMSLWNSSWDMAQQMMAAPFTERQVDIASSFSQLWDLLTENEETDFVTDLSDLWEKICDAESIPHWSADEIQNF